MSLSRWFCSHHSLQFAAAAVVVVVAVVTVAAVAVVVVVVVAAVVGEDQIQLNCSKWNLWPEKQTGVFECEVDPGANLINFHGIVIPLT